MWGFSEWRRKSVSGLSYSHFPLRLGHVRYKRTGFFFVLYFGNVIIFATPNGVDDTNLNQNVKDILWQFPPWPPELLCQTDASQSGAASVKNRLIFCIQGFRNDAVFSLCSWPLLCHQLLPHVEGLVDECKPVFSVSSPSPVLGEDAMLLKTFARGQKWFPAPLPTTHKTTGRSLCLCRAQVWGST